MPVHHPSVDLLCAVAAGQQSSGVQKVVLEIVLVAGERTEIKPPSADGGDSENQ